MQVRRRGRRGLYRWRVDATAAAARIEPARGELVVGTQTRSEAGDVCVHQRRVVGAVAETEGVAELVRADLRQPRARNAGGRAHAILNGQIGLGDVPRRVRLLR